MARVGPNQDINDPSTLENLRLLVEDVSVRANDHNNANAGITETKSQGVKVDEANTRLIPITTLLQKQDGSNLEITGFTTSGTFKQDNIDQYPDSVINTYINQAERFRGYYDSIVSSVNSWSDRDNGPIYVTPFVQSRTGVSGLPFGDHEGFSETNLRIAQKDGYAVIDQASIPTIIEWSGKGPNNYNANTYPQLTSTFTNLRTKLSESSQPFLDIQQELTVGTYSFASSTDGFSQSLDMFERVEWSNSVQKFAQTSNLVATNLDLPVPIFTSSAIKIPVMISNFTNSSQILTYSITVKMTPRNINNSVVQPGHIGFVYKTITIFTSPIVTNTQFISHSGSNTSEMNDAITNIFELQGIGTVFIAANTISVREILIVFINQLRLINGSFADWDTEDLLSDVNINLSLDGHFFNNDFGVGVQRSMWP